MAGVLSYRRLPSPLHAARASVGALWAGTLVVASVLLYHPLLLAAIGVAAICAGVASGVGQVLRRALRWAPWFVVPIVIVQVLISREGQTVFWRLGNLGPFGQGDLTVEALVRGLVLALQVTDVILICALASLAVDPDELLEKCARISFRSALTASLALRMVPLLAADAARLAEAQRTRPHPPARVRGKALLLGAAFAGALDRSLDVAATLELRGISTGRRVASMRRPLSRHDLAFAASAAAVLALALIGRLTGAAAVDDGQVLRLATSMWTVLLCCALVAATLLPFFDRRGVQR